MIYNTCLWSLHSVWNSKLFPIGQRGLHEYSQGNGGWKITLHLFFGGGGGRDFEFIYDFYSNMSMMIYAAK